MNVVGEVVVCNENVKINRLAGWLVYLVLVVGCRWRLVCEVEEEVDFIDLLCTPHINSAIKR